MTNEAFWKEFYLSPGAQLPAVNEGDVAILLLNGTAYVTLPGLWSRDCCEECATVEEAKEAYPGARCYVVVRKESPDSRESFAWRAKFNKWMKDVAKALLKLSGMSPDGIDDWSYADDFDKGFSAERTAERAYANAKRALGLAAPLSSPAICPLCGLDTSVCRCENPHSPVPVEPARPAWVCQASIPKGAVIECDGQLYNLIAAERKLQLPACEIIKEGAKFVLQLVEEQAMTNKEKVKALTEAQSWATEMILSRAKMMALRRQVLRAIREVAKGDLGTFAVGDDKDLQWMVDKMKRGYFGTDVKTEQLPRLLAAMLKVLEEKGKSES